MLLARRQRTVEFSQVTVGKVHRKFSVYLIISTEAGDDVTGFRDKQKMVHVLQGYVADTVTAAVSALGLARVVRTLLRAALNLRTEEQQRLPRPLTIWHCLTKILARIHGTFSCSMNFSLFFFSFTQTSSFLSFNSMNLT